MLLVVRELIFLIFATSQTSMKFDDFDGYPGEGPESRVYIRWVI